VFVLTGRFPNPLEDWMSPECSNELPVCPSRGESSIAPNVGPNVIFFSHLNILENIFNLLELFISFNYERKIKQTGN
jgi:hypothetical protein